MLYVDVVCGCCLCDIGQNNECPVNIHYDEPGEGRPIASVPNAEV